jgi:hypothetical protein
MLCNKNQRAFGKQMVFQRKSMKILLITLFLCFSCGFMGTQQTLENQDAPGPLSAVHSDSPGLQNCQKCHSPKMEIDDNNCLECHTEIASRISSKQGYHRDKIEGCGLCHPEHQGKGTKLIAMDILDFNHDETGYILKGAHQTVKECSVCHKKSNSLPREKTKSYLLMDSRCLACHLSSHPGRQDRCQTCHTQKNWRVDIWRN